MDPIPNGMERIAATEQKRKKDEIDYSIESMLREGLEIDPTSVRSEIEAIPQDQVVRRRRRAEDISNGSPITTAEAESRLALLQERQAFILEYFRNRNVLRFMLGTVLFNIARIRAEIALAKTPEEKEEAGEQYGASIANNEARRNIIVDLLKGQATMLDIIKRRNHNLIDISDMGNRGMVFDSLHRSGNPDEYLPLVEKGIITHGEAEGLSHPSDIRDGINREFLRIVEKWAIGENEIPKAITDVRDEALKEAESIELELEPAA